MCKNVCESEKYLISTTLSVEEKREKNGKSLRRVGNKYRAIHFVCMVVPKYE